MAKKATKKVEPTTEESSTTETEAVVEAAAEESGNETSKDAPEFGADAINEFLNDDDEEEGVEVEGEIVEATSDEKTTEPKPEDKGKEELKPEEEEKPKAEPALAAEKPEGEKPATEELKKEETPPIEPVVPAPEQAKLDTPPVDAPAAAESVPQLTPEEQTKAYEDWHDGVITELAEGRYAISDEQAEKMDMSPETMKVYSRDLAGVYMDAVIGAIGHITQALPQLLEAALITRNDAAGAETAFYDAWPKLNGKEHGSTIQRLGTAYRSLNPTVSMEDFIREVGSQAMVALRIPAEEIASQAPTEPTAPSEPFKPAGAGSPSGGPTTPSNVFTKLSAEFDEQEELDIE